MDRELIWEKFRVSDAFRLRVKNPTYVTAGTTVRELLPKLTEDLRTKHVYIVGNQKQLLGVIRMNDIVQFLFPGAAANEQKSSLTGIPVILPFARATGILNKEGPFECLVEDIMNDEPQFVTKNTPISDVAKIFLREKVYELPVVENDTLIGQVSVYEFIDTMLEEIEAAEGEH